MLNRLLLKTPLQKKKKQFDKCERKKKAIQKTIDKYIVQEL